MPWEQREWIRLHETKNIFVEKTASILKHPSDQSDAAALVGILQIDVDAKLCATCFLI